MGSKRTRPKQLELLPLESDPEAVFRRQGIVLLAGVDEVGRGPLAGPVVAAAVILPEKSEISRAYRLQTLDPGPSGVF